MKKPLIGVTSDYDNGRCMTGLAYCAAIEKAGGVPLAIPQLEDASNVDRLVEILGGILVIGGRDVPPERYGAERRPETRTVTPERDRFDFLIVEKAVSADVPVLSICYGIQLLNVVMGGDLYQDIASEIPGALRHSPREKENLRHRVRIENGTKLRRILGVETLETNSSHHQAVKRTVPPMVPSAFAEDGVIEAIESTQHRFVIGIQWHPERLVSEEKHLAIFEAFVKEVARCRETVY